MTAQIRLAVLAGGVLGTLLRLAVVAVVDVRTAPLGTLAVNLLGAYLLARLAGGVPDASPRLRAFLGTGLLGSFTTFSAMAVDLVALGGRPVLLLAYAIAVIGGGVALARLGLRRGTGVAGTRGTAGRVGNS